MKNIIFGILASLLFTSSVYAGKGKKKSKKSTKAETCTLACCDKTTCPPANCADMPVCKK